MVKCCTNTWDRKGLRRKAEGKNRCKTEGKKGIRVEVNKDKGENRVAVIDPLRDARWDPFVESHPFGWICHLSSWKRVLEESFPHMKGHYLALINEKENTIKAALPVFEVRSWLTGNRLVSIPFATLCDPLIKTPYEMKRLLESAIGLSKEKKIAYIEIKGYLSRGLIQNNCLSRSDFFINHYLLLEKKPEELQKTFHLSVRRRIKRALESKLVIISGCTESHLHQFYRLYIHTRKRLALPPQPFRFFKNLWDIFSPSQHMLLLLAELKGKIIGGMIVLKFKEKVVVEYLASDIAFRNISPDHFLYWEAIKMAHKEGYRIFNFGRTSLLNTGLITFKERWGTARLWLPQFYYPCSQGKTKDEQSLRYKIVQRVCSKAPAFALPSIGKFCYRHLG